MVLDRALLGVNRLVTPCELKSQLGHLLVERREILLNARLSLSREFLGFAEPADKSRVLAAQYFEFIFLVSMEPSPLQLRFQTCDLRLGFMIETDQSELLFVQLSALLIQSMAQVHHLAVPIFFDEMRRFALANRRTAGPICQRGQLVYVTE